MNIGRFLLGLTSEVWDFLKPVIALFAKEEGTRLAEIAYVVVKDIQFGMPDSPGESKQKIAFAKIKDELYHAGLDLAESVINLALEVAVQKVKSLVEK